MRVVQIAKNEVVTIHPVNDAYIAFCGSCRNEAVVAVDYSSPMVEPFRKYFCQEHLNRAELEEEQLCLSIT